MAVVLVVFCSRSPTNDTGTCSDELDLRAISNWRSRERERDSGSGDCSALVPNLE
jgi:hypothetical protein